MSKTLVNLDCPRCGKTQEKAWHSRKICAPCRFDEERFINRTLKGRAWGAVAKALKSGALDRLPCEVCGAEKTQAHHDDYAAPLNVRWLCLPHHRQHHLQFGSGKNASANSTTDQPHGR